MVGIAFGRSSSICSDDRCYNYTGVKRLGELSNEKVGQVECMTEMTPKGLARKITKLRATRPITAGYERTLVIRGVWR